MISKELFETNFEKLNDCWEWKGKQYITGYGRYWQDSISYYSHRVSFELYKNKIPNGKVIDHLCRNKLCVNPDHLEAVTIGQNVLRGESVVAKKARSQICPNGHTYPKNMKRNKRGWRVCKICFSKSSKKYQNKNMEKVREWKRNWARKNRSMLLHSG